MPEFIKMVEKAKQNVRDQEAIDKGALSRKSNPAIQASEAVSAASAVGAVDGIVAVGMVGTDLEDKT